LIWDFLRHNHYVNIASVRKPDPVAVFHPMEVSRRARDEAQLAQLAQALLCHHFSG
jgi:hypothetical protein